MCYWDFRADSCLNFEEWKKGGERKKKRTEERNRKAKATKDLLLGEHKSPIRAGITKRK
jgi:hypothetical protein